MQHLIVVKDNAEKGTNSTPPPAPIVYTLMKWRQATNTIRYEEDVTAAEFLTELEILDMEAQFKPSK